MRTVEPVRAAVIRPDTIRRYATERDLRPSETLDVEHPQFVLYRLVSPQAVKT